MRRLSVLFAVVGLLLSQAAYAAGPVNVEINGVQEQAGQMVANVSVDGADGKPIVGLTTGNFQVSLNDTPVVLRDAETGASSTPTSVLLVVDVSGSMQGASIDQARRALQDFVSGLDQTAGVAVMAFDSKVTLLQDFTTDRSLINQAITSLTPLGDTALYDAVIQASAKIGQAPPGRRLVVLLTDGQATVGLDQRAASLAAAQSSGVKVVSIGLGTEIDKQYLTDLATATGGHYLQAATAANLHQTYVDLASSIRSQYAVSLYVPSSIDRSQQTQLTVQVSYKSDSASATLTLDPLAGYTPPPFGLQLQGVQSGQKLTGAVSLQPNAADVALAKVDYSLDGQALSESTSPPFAYAFDPTGLAPGTHLLKVAATDDRGRVGEVQVPFVVAAAPQSHSFPVKTLLVVVVLLLVGGGLWLLLRRRLARSGPSGDYTTRIKPWSGREPEPVRASEWSDPAPAAVPLQVVPVDRILGQLIVMDEAKVKAGDFDAIREYEIRSTPLTLGSGSKCDVPLAEPDGTIGLEEARVWVQRGRLVYHKLTTLSAMATEGVTAGWIFLDSGEDLLLGPYRILFQATIEEAPVPDPAEQASTRTQEHGMGLNTMWSSSPDDSSRIEGAGGL